jgi:glutathione S-transferase
MVRRPTLYSLTISHYCISVERMLAFKGIPFERVYAPYHDRQEVVRATGQDYVPALVWGRNAVPWSDIPAFLDRQRPEPPLTPAPVAGLARALENWGHQVVEERVWRAVVTEVPPVLKDDRERWVFEEMQTRARGPWHVLQTRRPEFVEELQPYFALIDQMLEGRDWILGRPTVADFGIYGGVSPWLTVGHKIPPRFRNLQRWATRIGKL